MFIVIPLPDTNIIAKTIFGMYDNNMNTISIHIMDKYVIEDTYAIKPASVRNGMNSTTF